MLRRRILYDKGGGGTDYSKQYLTIVSLEDSNTISWVASDASNTKTIYVSTNEGSTWTAKTSTTSGVALATLNTGERLLIKYHSTAVYASDSYNNYFVSTKNFDVEGNIMSLTTSGDFTTALSVSAHAFRNLFYSCIRLQSAENLVLPATTLGSNCYMYMFYGCSGMTKMPKELPATTLGEYCYRHMFENCSSLTEVLSILPATTLRKYCYYQMFCGCSNIVTAPELPALTLARSCYYRMFADCSKLNKITCLATDVSATNCKINWVNGVASSGTFIKNANITTSTWTRGTSGIPNNWTVEDYTG